MNGWAGLLLYELSKQLFVIILGILFFTVIRNVSIALWQILMLLRDKNLPR
jgi:hypothetical protein